LEQFLLRLHALGDRGRPYRRIGFAVHFWVLGKKCLGLPPRGCDDHLGPLFTLGLVPRQAVGHAETGAAERTSQQDRVFHCLTAALTHGRRSGVSRIAEQSHVPVAPPCQRRQVVNLQILQFRLGKTLEYGRYGRRPITQPFPHPTPPPPPRPPRPPPPPPPQ